MISWYVGTEKGFNFSLGKNYKFLDKHISKELWDNLEQKILIKKEVRNYGIQK